MGIPSCQNSMGASSTSKGSMIGTDNNGKQVTLGDCTVSGTAPTGSKLRPTSDGVLTCSYSGKNGSNGLNNFIFKLGAVSCSIPSDKVNSNALNTFTDTNACGGSLKN